LLNRRIGKERNDCHRCVEIVTSNSRRGNYADKANGKHIALLLLISDGKLRLIAYGNILSKINTQNKLKFLILLEIHMQIYSYIHILYKMKLKILIYFVKLL